MMAVFGKTTPYIIAAALLLIAALLFWGGIQTVDGWISSARKQAIEERDAYWRAEISASNLEVQKQITENLKQTMAVQDAAVARASEAEARADELEKRNAELPVNSCGGLGRARGELLNER